ncbi:phosphoribosyltransferase [Brevibacterium spongiae]|uniref:Phosphoribosyltransferase n=1 Tax=Brevibacterium spongiae TaxID=2909672 RepID=A0ABY5SQT2_9MICO|nr:phosphoribosyltransferase [Brevibacterium spongiae]UVI36847.1 phosphoribosyltransferase [Brevibacterium spongiae]
MPAEAALMIAGPAVDRLTAVPGRVHDVLLRRSSPHADLRLYLSADTDAPLRHLEYCFAGDFDYEAVPERRRPRFNVATRWRGAELPYAAEDLITLLNQTLSLPSQGSLDLVTVLDWSAVAAGRMIDSGQERQARTPGELMLRARRRTTHPRMGALAIGALVAEMARVISDHPAYRDAAVIIGGPDSLEDEPNLRTQIAQELAEVTEKELVILRWPVWQISGSAPLMSSLDRRLHGTAIVVDDVWTDGATMSAVGQLARASGADKAFGLAATIAHATEHRT